MEETSLFALLPNGVSPILGLGLVTLSFITSGMTAAAGIGGGVVMLSVLASVLPPLVVLPIHGLVQVGSNAGRGFLLREHIDWRLLMLFSLGAIVGIAIGAKMFVALPIGILRGVIAVFILYSVWAPKLKPSNLPYPAYAAVGAVTSFATMFVGGTGSLVAAFLSPERFGRHGMVATHASCMTVQHTLKVIAFGFIGFAYLPWALLIAAMIGTGFLGTIVGRKLLGRMNEKTFRFIYRSVLTVLALRLLWSAGLAMQ